MTAQHESTKVQLAHINEALAGLAGKVDLLLDLTKTVAVMRVEADNHRDRTQQMELRLTEAQGRVQAELRAEEESRIKANGNIHERIDHLRKWVLTVSGGGVVVIALIGYMGESLKGFAAAYLESHDAVLSQKHELKALKERVDELFRQKAAPP